TELTEFTKFFTENSVDSVNSVKMSAFHLAQVNIARTRVAFQHPSMADFVSRVDGMNRLAEQSRGFVWRLRGSEATPDKLRVFENYFVPFELDRFFYNMSVWESVDGLREYVFKSSHIELLRGKDRWMDSFERASLAMWWVPAGHQPTIAESAERLRSVEQKGATPFAFTFQKIFPPPEME